MSFSYYEPDSVEETISLLFELGDEAAILSGGTGLAVLMKRGLIAESHLVGLRRIQSLRGIAPVEGGIWVGGMSSHRDVATSDKVTTALPMLARAYASVATIRIRNQATVGGGLGLGDPAQDPPAALVALDASVELTGRQGRRSVPAEEFFIDYFSTCLMPGELISGIVVPDQPGTRATYLKFLPRSLDDYPTVAVATSVRLDVNRRVEDIRVVMGAVGPKPMRATSVERVLMGTVPDVGSLEEISKLVLDEIEPMTDVRGSAEYKRAVAPVCLRRALMEVMT